MRTKYGWLGATLVLALAACGGDSKKETAEPAGGGASASAAPPVAPGTMPMQPLPPVPATPAAEPEAVLAVISLGDPPGQLASIGAFIDAIQPGIGAMANVTQMMPMMAGTVGAPGLDGYAADKPFWLVALDTKVAPGGSMLIVGIADAAKLRGSVGGGATLMIHGSYAAIGSHGALAVAGPWALSNLITMAPPRELALVVHVRRFMAGQGAELENALRQGMGPTPKPEEAKVFESSIAVLRQIERIEGRLVAAATDLSITGAVVPIGKTSLEAFAVAQQPTDFRFAARLPAKRWPLWYAGRIDFGPFRQFFIDLASSQGGPAAQVAQIFDLLGTEQAMAMTMKGDRPTMVASIGLTDGKQAAALIAATLTAKDQSWAIKKDAIKVKGGSMHELTEPKEQVTAGQKPMKLAFGVVGNAFLAAAEQGDPRKHAQTLASNASKTAKPKYGKQVAAAVTSATERKDSGLILVDVAALAAAKRGAKDPGELPLISIGLGFTGGRLSGTIYVPVEQVKQAVAQGL